MTDNTQSAAPKVETLSEMIDYQEGAVVSRTLLKKNTGTLTLFAFDKGEGLSEHTSPYEAFVHIIDGKSLITISGEEYHLESGEVITLPADDPHALKATERFKMLLTMIREK
ncbi:MAG: cupin domain-containing protein [Candidatus Marinimicrobia bacterium]|nr:cupin domain-containing protein [Candidatus Neomarinimicrobiota bacterium]MCF7829535.1 cupin domain-containing protein [Candidatus Neomarinimicrobiota bacterium]MCF7880067.1 cupin domain-containing protein [Candidatus Neomarinimicrobiota bacterium]